MKPTYFRNANRRLQKLPPAGSENFYPEYTHNDGVTTTACYRLSIRERISAFLFGRAWFSIKIGKDIVPAVNLVVAKEFFKPEKIPDVPMVAHAGCRKCHGTGSLGRDAITGREVVCSCLREKDAVLAAGHKVAPSKKNTV